jgi:hypothetical protein
MLGFGEMSKQLFSGVPIYSALFHDGEDFCLVEDTMVEGLKGIGHGIGIF